MRLPLLLCSLFGVAAVGCGPGTSVKVRIQNPTAMNATALEVAIYDDFGLMARKAPKPQLPGELTLVGLPAQSEKLRIVVKGTGSATLLGWATVATRSGSAVNADVSLSMDFKDSDGDFVPDEIDGCPNVADPDQLDSDGSSTGAGDACRGSGDPARCSGTLCDSFDMPSIDAGKWTTASSFGNVSIDTTRSFHGPSSLKVQLDALDGGALGTFGTASLVETTTFPASDIFVREYVFVPSGFPSNPAAISQVEQQGGAHGISLQVEQLGLSTFNSLGMQPQGQAPAAKIATNRWTCIEWEVKIGGSIHVWIDGAEVGALATPQNTQSTPAVGQVSIGLAGSAAAKTLVPARTLWIDEVAVGASRLGCLK